MGNLLRPGDEILMRLWPDTTLSGRFRIEQNGEIYLPVIGAVQALGRTPEQLRDVLIDRYSESIRSPIVLLTPRFRVTLLGAVRGQGIHWVDSNTTLFELIVGTGGLQEDAKPDEIRLLRRGQVFSVDIEDAMENRPTADVPLNSGDRILVPGRGFDWLGAFRTVVQTATLVFTVLSWTKLR